MSGRLTDGQMTRLTCGGFDGVLRKPFTVRQVIDTIEDAVNAAGETVININNTGKLEEDTEKKLALIIEHFKKENK